MDKNVELLLREEAEVNRKVQAAIAKKNEQLKSIKREAEIAMKDWRKEKELEFDRKLQKVSCRCLFIFLDQRRYWEERDERFIGRRPRDPAKGVRLKQEDRRGYVDCKLYEGWLWDSKGR